MLKSALGALLAAIAMFVWGFVYWGSGLVDPFAHMTPEAETALGEALKANLTVDGVYVLPDSKNGTEEDWMQRMSAGPFAMANFKSGGTPPMGTTLALGFVHMLVTTILLAVLLMYVTPAATYFDRLKIVAAIGLIAAVFVHFAQPIWWHYPWTYAVLGAIYDFGAYLISGAVLAYFVSPANA
jgi:hypothetical protein